MAASPLGKPSPVPAYRIWGLEGAWAMLEMDSLGASSVTGVHLLPDVVVLPNSTAHRSGQPGGSGRIIKVDH